MVRSKSWLMESKKAMGTRDGLILRCQRHPPSLHLARARFAVLRVAAGRRRDEGAAGERGGAGECDVGRVAVLTGEREILSQREERVAFPHEDAAQVGMAGE